MNTPIKKFHSASSLTLLPKRTTPKARGCNSIAAFRKPTRSRYQPLTMGVVIAAWIHRYCNSRKLSAHLQPAQWTQFMGIKSQGALS